MNKEFPISFLVKGKVGEHRIIPKGVAFWSISNQIMMTVLVPQVVEIGHISSGSDTVFVKPKWFSYYTGLPKLVEQGIDEWMVNYSETLPYSPQIKPEISDDVPTTGL